MSGCEKRVAAAGSILSFFIRTDLNRLVPILLRLLRKMLVLFVVSGVGWVVGWVLMFA